MEVEKGASVVEVVDDDVVEAVALVVEVVEEDGPGSVAVVETDVELVMLEVVAPVMTGAATLRGARGRSLTRSSAALTICQVRVVARTRTPSHAANRLNRFTLELSQES